MTNLTQQYVKNKYVLKLIVAWQSLALILTKKVFGIHFKPSLPIQDENQISEYFYLRSNSISLSVYIFSLSSQDGRECNPDDLLPVEAAF